MEIADLLKQYIKKNGNEKVEFSWDETFGSILSIDGGNLNVKIEPHNNEVWFHCAIFDIPHHNKEHFYEKLLVSQLFGQLTRGAHFSLDLNQKNVLLCKTLTTEGINEEIFDHTLTEFIETCLLWKATLTNSAKNE